MVRFSAGWFLIRVRAAAAACSHLIEKILIGIAVVAALPAAYALAADLEVRAPPPVRVSNWSGPYIGIGIGGRFNAVDANVASATVGTPPVAIPLPNVSSPEPNPLLNWWGAHPGAHQYVDHIAVVLRVYGGWNFQVAPAYVVGVEADFAYANETAVFQSSPYPVNLFFGSPTSLPFGASPNDGFRVSTTWDGSARLRAGWLANPSMMLYLTAGVAWAHFQVTSQCSIEPTPSVSNCAPGNYFGGTLGPAEIVHSATMLGWTGGGGVELLLGSNWVARAQYRYSDFGYSAFKPFSFTATRACSGCPSATSSPLTVSIEVPVMQHTFEFGLAYKFGQ